MIDFPLSIPFTVKYGKGVFEFKNKKYFVDYEYVLCSAAFRKGEYYIVSTYSILKNLKILLSTYIVIL